MTLLIALLAFAAGIPAARADLFGGADPGDFRLWIPFHSVATGTCPTINGEYAVPANPQHIPVNVPVYINTDGHRLKRYTHYKIDNAIGGYPDVGQLDVKTDGVAQDIDYAIFDDNHNVIGSRKVGTMKASCSKRHELVIEYQVLDHGPNKLVFSIDKRTNTVTEKVMPAACEADSCAAQILTYRPFVDPDPDPHAVAEQRGAKRAPTSAVMATPDAAAARGLRRAAQ